MTLADYIDASGMTLTKFAELIGMSVSTVSRITRGVHVPEFETMLEIQRVTNGKVTPNDFRPADTSKVPADA